jgi:hypothetical protein
VQLLMGAAVDTWDRVRDGTCRLLAMFPAPLPGVERCACHPRPALTSTAGKWVGEPYSDERVANRDVRVWHGATENGP